MGYRVALAAGLVMLFAVAAVSGCLHSDSGPTGPTDGETTSGLSDSAIPTGETWLEENFDGVESPESYVVRSQTRTTFADGGEANLSISGTVSGEEIALTANFTTDDYSVGSASYFQGGVLEERRIIYNASPDSHPFERRISEPGSEPCRADRVPRRRKGVSNVDLDRYGQIREVFDKSVVTQAQPVERSNRTLYRVQVELESIYEAREYEESWLDKSFPKGETTHRTIADLEDTREDQADLLNRADLNGSGTYYFSPEGRMERARVTLVSEDEAVEYTVLVDFEFPEDLEVERPSYLKVRQFGYDDHDVHVSYFSKSNSPYYTYQPASGWMFELVETDGEWLGEVQGRTWGCWSEVQEFKVPEPPVKELEEALLSVDRPLKDVEEEDYPDGERCFVDLVHQVSYHEVEFEVDGEYVTATPNSYCSWKVTRDGVEYVDMGTPLEGDGTPPDYRIQTRNATFQLKDVVENETGGEWLYSGG